MRAPGLVILLACCAALPAGAAPPKPGDTVSTASIRARCVPVGSRELAHMPCRVAKTGPVPGSGGTLYYQLQDYLYEGIVMSGGVVVFAAGAAGSWQRILDATEADAAYDEPTLFHDDVGTFLDLGGHTLGTGQFPLGSLFQHRGESWTKIDVRGWQTELAKRLPKGMSVWRGPYPDYPHFAATAVVRREPPPEGADPDQDDEGYAAIRLALKGDGLTIDRAAWKIGVENPCQIMPDYPGCK